MAEYEKTMILGYIGLLVLVITILVILVMIVQANHRKILRGLKNSESREK